MLIQPLVGTSGPHTRDETLVKNFIQGDKESFSVLIDRYFNTKLSLLSGTTQLIGALRPETAPQAVKSVIKARINSAELRGLIERHSAYKTRSFSLALAFTAVVLIMALSVRRIYNEKRVGPDNVAALSAESAPCLYRKCSKSANNELFAGKRNKLSRSL